MIFSTAYFPSIEYFMRVFQTNEILLESKEFYIKQTYRNRCNILTNQGLMPLIIPVLKKFGNKTLIKDIEIEFDTDWQATHFKSIDTAYGSSPFYEFYIDDFRIFFEKKFKFLFDFNTLILERLLEVLDFEKKINFSTVYENSYPLDLRNSIHPKKQSNSVKFKEYTQVFNTEGFVPNLSILDLLFNEGTESYKYL